MGLFSKLVGGLVGFGIGGPIGAIIGVVLVNSFTSDEKRVEYNSSHAPSPEAEQNRFIFALLVLIATVLKADGVVKKSELPYVKQFLLKSFGEEKTREALLMLKDILKQNIDAAAVAQQLSTMMDYPVRLELLHMLFNVAQSDTEIVEEELNVIELISSNLRISTLDFTSIKAMFGDVKQNNWAYDILAIDPSVSDDEVKTAYRKMAMKYHPDKVLHLGEEIKQSSEEKFKQVKNAYDHIKKERNIN